MRTFTIDQYIRMASKFNKMNFDQKLECLNNNSDILTLDSDGNWWGVRPVDKDIRFQLEEKDVLFEIENEWGHSEMMSILNMTKITLGGLTD